MPNLEPTRLDRCTGHCCRFFTLSHSWEDVKRFRHRHLMDGVPEYTSPAWQDMFYIIDMLVPVGKGRDGTERFTCTHLSKDGQCMDYEKRPRMCREFGVEKSNPCIFIGTCTWTSGLHGPPVEVKPKQKEPVNGGHTGSEQQG